VRTYPSANDEIHFKGKRKVWWELKCGLANEANSSVVALRVN
jgi:hypothetical protein